MERISVIVPVYNVAPYVEECLRSIIEQSYAELEILVINDGSTDDSGRICKEIARGEPRMTVIDQENSGLSGARNTGIERAQGEYLLFVDSDDRLMPDAIRTLYTAVKREGAKLGLCGFHSFGDGIQEQVFQPASAACRMNGFDIMRAKAMHSGEWGWVVVWNRLYHRALFERLRFAKGKLYEDEFIFHEIMEQCDVVACIPDVLYEYRKRPDSIMGRRPSIRRLDGVEALLLRCRAYLAYRDMDREAVATFFVAMYIYERYYRVTGFACEGEHKTVNDRLQALIRTLGPQLKRIAGVYEGLWIGQYCADVYRGIRRKVTLSRLKQRILRRR